MGAAGNPRIGARVIIAAGHLVAYRNAKGRSQKAVVLGVDPVTLTADLRVEMPTGPVEFAGVPFGANGERETWGECE